MDMEDHPRPTTRRIRPVTMEQIIINAIVDENMDLLRSLEDDIISDGHLDIAMMSAASRFHAEVIEWLFSISDRTTSSLERTGMLITKCLQQVTALIEIHEDGSADDDRVTDTMEVLMRHWHPTVLDICRFIRQMTRGLSEHSLKLIFDPILENISKHQSDGELQYALVDTLVLEFGKEAIREDLLLDGERSRWMLNKRPALELNVVLQSEFFKPFPMELGAVVVRRRQMFEFTALLMKAGAQVEVGGPLNSSIALFGESDPEYYFKRRKAFRRFVIEYSVAGYPLPERFNADQDYNLTLRDKDIGEITQRRLDKFREFGNAYGAGTLGAIRSRVRGYIREHYTGPYKALMHVRVGGEREMIPTDLIREIIAMANNNTRA